MKRFNAVEILTFVYGLLTAAYILVFFVKIDNAVELLLNRGAIFVALFLIRLVEERFPNRATGFVRYVFPFAMVSYWYPETYYLNEGVLVSNLDPFFDIADRVLFGCSPAMEFSAHCSSPLMSELMYFGYFSYFLIFLLLFASLYFRRSAAAERAMFVTLCSFFMFYLIFVFVPVKGPQFHYPAEDVKVPDGYFFSSLMRSIQASGEKPTGAFPSSHVGMTLIALAFIRRYLRRMFLPVLPVAAALTASTVYIKAHYLTDVIAAFIAAPALFVLSSMIFGMFSRWDFASYPSAPSTDAPREAP
jgi:membrane-associated phospholipid phosphatase